MSNIKLSTLLTLSMSFCLSVLSYIAAQPDDIPVQHLEFDDFVIEAGVPVVVMPEESILASSERNLIDDRDAWCFIHPDDSLCLDKEDEDEDSDEDSDEECGC